MKKCFRCNNEKPLSEFYKHSMMADGHLNKCKECTRADSKKTYEKIQSTPELAIRERKRQRIKENRRRLEGKTKKYIYKKQKRPAQIVFNAAVKSGKVLKKPCEICGKEKSQGHHEDYSKPLDVVWLCVRHHNDRHIHLRDCKTLGKEPLSIEEFILTIQKNTYD
jgi:hypothetical protein